MMPAVSHRGRTGWHHWSSGKARDTQSTMGGCWVSNNMPRAPAVLIIKFTRADSSPPKSSNSQDAQDAHQRPQRRGNKEVLDLVLCSRWYLQPLNAADERQSASDETRTSWEEEMDGDITIWSEKDQKYSLQGPMWPENHNYVGDREHGGDTAWEQVRVQGDLHLLHPEHHQQHQHQLQRQHLWVQLRGGRRPHTEWDLRGANKPEERVFCLDKLTGIRLRDINMTKIENLDYTIS